LIVYLIIFWILALSALLMELKLTKNARYVLFTLSYLLLVLFVGLRWETGNDWPDYLNYYKHLPFPDPRYSSFEPGYRFLNLCIKDMELPFAGFNLIYAALYLGLMFLSFEHDNLDVSGWLILQLYTPILFGLMGTTRQAMAVAICMFSVRYLLANDLRRFLLCVGVATTFHISAPAFLIAWPVARFRLNLRRVLLIFPAVLLASMLNVGGLAVKSAEEHFAVLRMADLESHLVLEEESSQAMFKREGGEAALILPTISRFGLAILFILCYNHYAEEPDQLYLKLYIISILIVVLFSSTAYVLADRVSLYFSIFQIHLLALLTRRIRIPAIRKLCCAALLAISLSRLWTSTHMSSTRIFIPYKSVFINQDVRRDFGWF
jgi:hypothetical protein